MTEPARFFCSDAARIRGDSIVGTAPHGSVWVLIEYRGAWPANGFDGLDLAPGVKALVLTAAQAARARVLLVRRHGPPAREGSGRWAVLRYESSGAYRQQWGTWRCDEDLAQIVKALGAPGELGCPPVVLVCAHEVVAGRQSQVGDAADKQQGRGKHHELRPPRADPFMQGRRLLSSSSGTVGTSANRMKIVPPIKAIAPRMCM